MEENDEDMVSVVTFEEYEEISEDAEDDFCDEFLIKAYSLLSLNYFALIYYWEFYTNLFFFVYVVRELGCNDFSLLMAVTIGADLIVSGVFACYVERNDKSWGTLFILGFTKTRMLHESWRANKSNQKNYEQWQVSTWQTIFQSVYFVIYQFYYILEYHEYHYTIFLSMLFSLSQIVATISYQDFKGFDKDVHGIRPWTTEFANIQIKYRTFIIVIRACEVISWCTLYAALAMWNLLYVILGILGMKIISISLGFYYLRNDDNQFWNEIIEFGILNSFLLDPMIEHKNAWYMSIWKAIFVVACFVIFWNWTSIFDDFPERQWLQWVNLIATCVMVFGFLFASRNLWSFKAYVESRRRENFVALVIRGRSDEVIYVIATRQTFNKNDRNAFYRLLKNNNSTEFISKLLKYQYFPNPESMYVHDDGAEQMKRILTEGARLNLYPKDLEHKKELYNAWALKYFNRLDREKYEEFTIFERDDSPRLTELKYEHNRITDEIKTKEVELEKLKQQKKHLNYAIMREKERLEMENMKPADTPLPKPKKLPKDKSKKFRTIFFDELVMRVLYTFHKNLRSLDDIGTVDAFWKQRITPSHLHEVLEDNDIKSGFYFVMKDEIQKLFTEIEKRIKHEKALNKLYKEIISLKYKHPEVQGQLRIQKYVPTNQKANPRKYVSNLTEVTGLSLAALTPTLTAYSPITGGSDVSPVNSARESLLSVAPRNSGLGMGLGEVVDLGHLNLSPIAQDEKFDDHLTPDHLTPRENSVSERSDSVQDPEEDVEDKVAEVTLLQFCWYIFTFPTHTFLDVVMDLLVEKMPKENDKGIEIYTPEMDEHLKTWYKFQKRNTRVKLLKQKIKKIRTFRTPKVVTEVQQETIEKLEFVQKTPWFINLTSEQHAKISEGLQAEEVAEGKILPSWELGHDGYLYIVYSGELRFKSENQLNDFPLKKYDVFGAGVFEANDVQYDVVATTGDCKIMKIKKKTWDEIKGMEYAITFDGRLQPHYESLKAEIKVLDQQIADEMAMTPCFFHSDEDFDRENSYSTVSVDSNRFHSEDEIHFLQNVPLFGGLFSLEREMIIKASETKTYRRRYKEVDLKQQYLYIIVSGVAKIYNTNQGDLLRPGTAGEVLGLENVMGKATCQSKIMPIGKDGFDLFRIKVDYLKPIRDLCIQTFSLYSKEYDKQEYITRPREPWGESLQQSNHEVYGGNFSKGSSFRVVLDTKASDHGRHSYMVQIKTAKEHLCKAQMVKSNNDTSRNKIQEHMKVLDYFQQGVLVQSMCDNQFIKKHYGSFDDQKHLYLLEEYAFGGSLEMLMRRGVLEDVSGAYISEHDLKFYAANMIAAISYLHDQKIVHRNIKAENFWIRSDGYLVLGNFGYAKHIGFGKTSTIIGDPNYRSPEMQGKNYSFEVDWWAFGVTLHQMIFQENPYTSLEELEEEGIRQMTSFSNKGNDFLNSLLNDGRHLRLGSLANQGAHGIKNHPWFGSGYLKGEIGIADNPFEGSTQEFWYNINNLSFKPPWMFNKKNFEDTWEEALQSGMEIFSAIEMPEDAFSLKDDLENNKQHFSLSEECNTVEQIQHHEMTEPPSVNRHLERQTDEIKLHYLSYLPVQAMVNCNEVSFTDFASELGIIQKVVQNAYFNVRLSKAVFKEEALLRNAHIIHIAGEGVQRKMTFEDGLGASFFIDLDGNPCENADAILKKFGWDKMTFKKSTSDTKIAILMICKSEHIGHALIALGIKHVICIKDGCLVTSRACEIFAEGFYKRLFNSKDHDGSIRKAFQETVSRMAESKVFLLLPEDKPDDPHVPHDSDLQMLTNISPMKKKNSATVEIQDLPVKVAKSLDVGSVATSEELHISPHIALKIIHDLNKYSCAIVHGSTVQARKQMAQIIATQTHRLGHFRDGVIAREFQRRLDSKRDFIQMIVYCIHQIDDYKNAVKYDEHGESLINFLQRKSTCLLLYASQKLGEEVDWLGTNKNVRYQIYELLIEFHDATRTEYEGNSGGIFISLTGRSYREFLQYCRTNKSTHFSKYIARQEEKKAPYSYLTDSLDIFKSKDEMMKHWKNKGLEDEAILDILYPSTCDMYRRLFQMHSKYDEKFASVVGSYFKDPSSIDPQDPSKIEFDHLGKAIEIRDELYRYTNTVLSTFDEVGEKEASTKPPSDDRHKPIDVEVSPPPEIEAAESIKQWLTDLVFDNDPKILLPENKEDLQKRFRKAFPDKDVTTFNSHLRENKEEIESQWLASDVGRNTVLRALNAKVQEDPERNLVTTRRVIVDIGELYGISEHRILNYLLFDPSNAVSDELSDIQDGEYGGD